MPLKPATNPDLRWFFIEVGDPVVAFPHPVTVQDAFTVDHARKVLRLSKGDRVLAVDGALEMVYLAEIIVLEKKTMVLNLLQTGAPVKAAQLPTVTLGVALIKEQRWDWMLQKTTELGVRTVVPLMASRCVVQVHDPEKKQQRWQAVARSAAEQSEGLFIPRITTPMALEAFCRQAQLMPLKLLLLERGPYRKALKRVLRHHHPVAEIVAVIGPEGGWSEAEIDGFLAQGFQPVSLGNRILRSETAATTLMSALNYEYDEQQPDCR